MILVHSVEGAAEWQAPDEGSGPQRVKAGDSIVWPAGSRGALAIDGNLSSTTLAVAPSLVAAEPGSPGRRTLRRLSSGVRDDPLVTHLGRALGELSRGRGMDATSIAGPVSDALAPHLLRAYSCGPVPGTGRGGLADTVLDRTLGFIEANLTERITVERLARAAHLSTYHFSRLFRESTGQSPHRFIVSRRLARAREMIRAGAALGEAALRSGFSSQSHLHRHFRREYGVTLGQFQRSAAEHVRATEPHER